MTLGFSGWRLFQQQKLLGVLGVLGVLSLLSGQHHAEPGVQEVIY